MLSRLVKEKNSREGIAEENPQHEGEAGLMYDRRRKIQIIQGNRLNHRDVE